MLESGRPSRIRQARCYAWVLALALGACGGTGGSPQDAVGGVHVTPLTASLAVGETVQLAVSLTGVTGTPDLSVTWSSDEVATAIVDSSGLVTAVAPGTAIISATSVFDGTKSGAATVTVELDPLAPGLEYLTEAEAALNVRGLKSDVVAIAAGFLESLLAQEANAVPYSVGIGNGAYPAVGYFFVPVPLVVFIDPSTQEVSLATGTYEYDETTFDWTYEPTPADAFVARWRSQTSAGASMELRIDWHDLVEVTMPPAYAMSVMSMPRAWDVTVVRNGDVIVDLEGAYGFRACGDLLIGEPSVVEVRGVAGDGVVQLEINELRATLSDSDTLGLVVDAVARSGSLSLGVEMALDADLELVRDASCWPVEVSGLAAIGELRLSGPLPVPLIRGDITLSEDTLGGFDIALRNGRLVFGSKRADIVATVSSAEPDPLSSVYMTFAGGVVKDLISFIQDNGLVE